MAGSRSLDSRLRGNDEYSNRDWQVFETAAMEQGISPSSAATGRLRKPSAAQ